MKHINLELHEALLKLRKELARLRTGASTEEHRAGQELKEVLDDLDTD